MAGYSPFRARGAFGAAPAPAPSPFQAGGAVAGPRDLDCPLPAGADSVQALGWSPTANFLCAGTWDSMVCRWRMPFVRRGCYPDVASVRVHDLMCYVPQWVGDDGVLTTQLMPTLLKHFTYCSCACGTYKKVLMGQLLQLPRTLLRQM